MQPATLSRTQQLAIANGLAMGTLKALVAKLQANTNVLGADTVAQGVAFAKAIAPLYPIPRDGHIPRKVLKLINA